jgi:hypothetical protein
MKKFLFYTLIATIFLSGVQISHATIINPDRSTYTLLEPLPCVPTRANPCQAGTEITTFTVNQFIEYVFKFIIALAVLLATIQVIIGGFQYMGNDSYSSKNDAKKRFRDAATGLIGALVSFLVLQTIDPRLVQIHAEIDPICTTEALKPGGICNTDEIVDFNRNLNSTLKNLTSERIAQVNALEGKRSALMQKISDLKDQYVMEDPDSPDFITREQYELKLMPLNFELADVNAEQAKLIADGLGLSDFRLAREQIYSTTGAALNTDYVAPTSPNTPVGGLLPVNSKNTIQNKYNKYINEIMAIQPQTELTKAAAKTLESQRNFYITQVKEEGELAVNVKENGTRVTQSLGEGATHTYTADNSKYLKEKLTEYQANIKDPAKAAASGLDVKTYNELMQTRISSIEQALKPK